MIRKTTSFLVAAALGVLVALNGCSKPDETTTSQQASPPVPKETLLQKDMMVPLVLKLRGPDPVPASGEIRLDLEIVVNEVLSAPAELSLVLPPGVQLVSGSPSETIELTQKGTLQRQFVLQTSAPLQGPIEVTADVKSPTGAYGLHAKRQYPEPSKPTYTSPVRPPAPRPPTAPAR